MELKITVDAIEVVKDAAQRLMDEAEWKDNVSDEYKRGFYDFGNAIIAVLEAIG